MHLNSRFFLIAAGLGMLSARCGGDAIEGSRRDVVFDTSAPDTSGPDGVTPADTASDGTDTETPTDTEGDGQGEALCAEAGGIGCACTSNNDCNSSRCIEGPDGKICTRECIESCPDGFDCTTIGGPGDGASICVPRHVSLCRPCQSANDCRIGFDSTARCVPAADTDEGSFCATSCANLPCPDGYACEDVASGDGDATARLCVPEEGALCECRPSWEALGLQTTCFNTNAIGVCSGARTCGPDGLMACSAPAATQETCNNNDDDCDGTPDDITPEPCELATDGIETTCSGLTACAEGALVCTGRAPSPEICDNVDNDCDGTLDDSTSNCLDAGCTPVPGSPSYIDNGPPSCFEGGCVYANPISCGYFTCSGGASGATCATSCTDDTRCIANATCVGGACQCAVGYAGPACEQCAMGYQDNDADGTCLPGCALTPCDAVGGVCDDADGTAMCTCNEGYTTADCGACDMPAYTDPDGDGACERRGEVEPGPAPGDVARVGKVWRFAMAPTQSGWMPGDAFAFTLEAGPETMAVDPTTGEIAWTPAPEDQTWNADPTLSTRTTVTIRATAPDGQFAEHTVQLQVLPAVFVTGMHPAAGLATGGEPLLVFGAGFVEPEGVTGSIGVAFGQIQATAVTIVDENTLSVTTAAAPAGTQPLVIVLDGDPEVELRPGFTHLPVLAENNPRVVDLNTNLTLTARGYDPNDRRANVLSVASRDLSEFRVPASDLPNGFDSEFSVGVSSNQAGFATGPIFLVVNGLRSNAVPLRINDTNLPPRLAVTSATPAAPGAAMTLTGAGFAGLAPADLDLRFTGAAAPAAVTSVNTAGTQVVVTVPADAVTGPIRMAAPGRVTVESSVAVTVTGTTAPLDAFYVTPETVRRGQALVIVGQGFVDASPAAHTVRIGASTARVLSAEAQRLVVDVPADADFGANAVTVEVADVTLEAGVVAVTGRLERLIGGTPSFPQAADGDAPDAGLAGDALAFDDGGLMFVAMTNPQRVYGVNRTAAPITAYGRTFPPNTLVAVRSGGGSSIAVHPATRDLYVSTSIQVWRIRRDNGQEDLYAGLPSAGNTGDGGSRLEAAFSGIAALAFTRRDDEHVLLISDNNNRAIRAINTTSASVSRWGVSLLPNIVVHVANGAQSNPMGLAVDANDNIYWSNFNTVSKVRHDRDPTEVPGSSVILGLGATIERESCPANAGRLRFVHRGLAVDRVTGELFMGTRGGVIRRMRPSGPAEDGVNEADCVEVVAGRWPEDDVVPTAGHGPDGEGAEEGLLPLLSHVFIDEDGHLFVTGSGLVKRILRPARGEPTVIDTVAGRPPFPIEGMAANTPITNNFTPTVDAARGRIYLGTGGRVVAYDLATRTVSAVVGTGVQGNTPPGAPLLASDMLSCSAGALMPDGRLALIETFFPRAVIANLDSGLLEPLAGDGVSASGAEQNTVGPAADARVAINTGSPDIVAHPSGLLLFADQNIVRVVNPTAATLSAYGVTLEAGFIGRLPDNLGSNLSGLHIDEAGDLWVLGMNSQSIRRVPAEAPHTPVTLLGNDSVLRAYLPPMRLRDFRPPGPSGITRLEGGDLLVIGAYHDAVYHIRAHADGTLDGDSLVAPVFGNGTGVTDSNTARFNAVPAAFPIGALRKLTRDGDSVLVTASGLWRLHMDE